MQIKQVDCKMSIKRNYFKKPFSDIFRQLHTQEYKATKKCIVRLQLNLDPSTSFRCKRKTKKEIFNLLKLLWGRDWLQLNEKKSMESQTRLMN